MDEVVVTNVDAVQVLYSMPVLPDRTATTRAQALVIDSQEMYEYGNTQLRIVKELWVGIEAKRKAMVDPLNKSKAAIQDFFNPVLDDLAGAEEVYKGAMLTYKQERDRVRREEQAANDEAARKERERLQRDAEKAAAKGHVERAEVLQATAAVITAPIATSTYITPKGLGTTKKWKGRVVDKHKAIASLLANPAFLDQIVEIHQAALDRLAVATKGALDLDGIEFFEDEILSSRRAA